jgi:hypothetical protein
MKIAMRSFGILVAAILFVQVMQVGPVAAATFSLGSSAASTCGNKSSNVTGGVLLDWKCITAVRVFDSDTGDVYGCQAQFEFWFLNGNYQQQPLPNSITCGKTISLITPQAVDSKVVGLPPGPVNLGPGFTPHDVSGQTYWYANKQGAAGVCMFMSFGLPSPTFLNTAFGPEICIDYHL